MICGITEASTTRSARTPRTPQMRIDHRGGVVAHAAGADRVVEGLRIAADGAVGEIGSVITGRLDDIPD
jgi:hypothetical protein